MKVELLKHPTQEDWVLTRDITLNTVSKRSTKDVTLEWKKKLLASGHSPIRTLNFVVRMEIPSWVSVHLVRHKIGVEHFVSTQRSDRTGEDRGAARQDTLVSHMMWFNADALIKMCHARLCKQASKETTEVMQRITDLVLESNPEFEDLLVPRCYYRGGLCTEFYPCGYNKTYKATPICDKF